MGPHLVRELSKRKCNVVGVGLNEEPAELECLLAKYITCDLTDEAATNQIDFKGIDSVIHLAGLSLHTQSFEHPRQYIADNSAMLINLFEAALKQRPDSLPCFVVISSSAVYDTSQPMPLTEEGKVANGSPYAISKLLNEHLCSYYRQRGFECIVVRPFNHTGPGQGPGFLFPDLVAQVLSAGDKGTIQVGNLDAERDYSDVRDIVRAYADLALHDKPDHDLFNVCSGKARSGHEVLRLIVTACFGDKASVKTVLDKQKLRPLEPSQSVIVGDSSRARSEINWQPQIAFEQTITDYVAWARSQQN